MKNVNISEFRAHLLKYLQMAQCGEQINVTSKGKSLATLTPPVEPRDISRARLKHLARTAIVHDVLSPIGEEWDVMK